MNAARVIVNADDLGLNAEVNQIIWEAFDQRCVSSATLMANMPAFDEACAGVAERALHGAVGLHFNLTYGQPLTDGIRRHPLFCRDGQFDLQLSPLQLHLDADTRRVVTAELQAQWERCVRQAVLPSHIDSHQHVHNRLPIGALVAAFAGQKRVPVRLARNLGRNIGPLKQVYKTLLNASLRRRCPATVSQVCTPRDLLDGLRPGPLVEIVAHPRRLPDGNLGDDYLPDDQTLSQLLERCLPNHQRITYSALLMS